MLPQTANAHSLGRYLQANKKKKEQTTLVITQTKNNILSTGFLYFCSIYINFWSLIEIKRL